jgi:hypothetical protein
MDLTNYKLSTWAIRFNLIPADCDSNGVWRKIRSFFCIIPVRFHKFLIFKHFGCWSICVNKLFTIPFQFLRCWVLNWEISHFLFFFLWVYLFMDSTNYNILNIIKASDKKIVQRDTKNNECKNPTQFLKWLWIVKYLLWACYNVSVLRVSEIQPNYTSFPSFEFKVSANYVRKTPFWCPPKFRQHNTRLKTLHFEENEVKYKLLSGGF